MFERKLLTWSLGVFFFLFWIRKLQLFRYKCTTYNTKKTAAVASNIESRIVSMFDLYELFVFFGKYIIFSEANIFLFPFTNYCEFGIHLFHYSCLGNSSLICASKSSAPTFYPQLFLPFKALHWNYGKKGVIRSGIIGK